MAQVITLPGVQPVDEGETLVVEALTKALPDSYLLYPNLEITEPHRQPYEYDLIVVAPHAVYVVEIKRWLGRIAGGDYHWQLSSGILKPNPLGLANQKARILKSRLKRCSPNHLKDVWVEACVIIADAHTQLSLIGAAARRTFRYPDAARFLQDPSRLVVNGRPIAHNAIEGLQSRIRDAIEQEARVRTSGPHLIGSYEVVETLRRTELTDEYVARHRFLPELSRVRLRLFTSLPYAQPNKRKQQQARIERDAEALRSIGAHPNLVSIRDLFPHESGHFVEVTNWSESGTLRDLLEQNYPLSLEEKIKIIGGIAAGLGAAHANDVIHRNVRPENILIGSELTPQLINFEYALLEQSEPTIDKQTTVWRLIAPDADRRYLPPELDQINYSASKASDLYALGAIIYELCAGKVPFDNSNELQKAGGAPTLSSLAPHIPSELSDLAATLYQYDLASRCYSAEQVEDIVKNLFPPFYMPGQHIKGEFKVLKYLGGGAFGQVYKVEHDFAKEVYAMKVINGHYSLERLQEEYRILSELDHPNIAKVRWAGRIHSEQFFLVLEYIEGQVLTEFIKPEALLLPEKVVSLIKQLLGALEYLHQPNQEHTHELRCRKQEGGEMTREEDEELQIAERRFLHRDIKPENLMLTSNDELKLIDFNIAARLERELHYTLIGTPPYFAPDIGELGWDESSDLFAVGVVCYQLITGHHPYPNAKPSLQGVPQNPQIYRPELSRAFADFLLKAVQPHREKRFRTAQDMYAALLKAGDPVVVPPPPGNPILTYTGHRDAVYALAWAPDGQHIASGGADTTVQVWNAVTGTLVNRVRFHDQPVNALAWSPHRDELASASKKVRIWEATTGAKNVLRYDSPDQVTALIWASNGTQIVFATEAAGGRVIWRNLATISNALEEHGSKVAGLALSPPGDRLVSVGECRIVIWDMNSHTKLFTYQHPHGAITSVSWSPGGKFIATGSGLDGVGQIDVWEMRREGMVQSHTWHAGRVTNVAWSPKGDILASADEDGKVVLWDATTWHIRDTYTHSQAAIQALAWAPKEKRIASASKDGTVCIWQVK